MLLMVIVCSGPPSLIIPNWYRPPSFLFSSSSGLADLVVTKLINVIILRDILINFGFDYPSFDGRHKSWVMFTNGIPRD